jgi:hypothetical protein
MSERPSEQLDPEAEAPQGGVFGNLPDSRPGGRSPRRDAAAKPRKPRAAAAKTSAKRRPAAKPAAPVAAKAKRTPSQPPQEAPEAESGTGLEDIAWAGVATVAEAATIGVRLLNRTLEALRGSSERS